MTCERCGYPGVPTYWRGRVVGCPRCDQFPRDGLKLIAAIREQGFGLRIRPRRPPTADELRAAGRNDPCPCGSGAKYKRCHGR